MERRRHDSLHFAVLEGDAALVAALLAAGAATGEVRIRLEGPGWSTHEHVEGHREIVGLLTPLIGDHETVALQSHQGGAINIRELAGEVWGETFMRFGVAERDWLARTGIIDILTGVLARHVGAELVNDVGLPVEPLTKLPPRE